MRKHLAIIAATLAMAGCTQESIAVKQSREFPEQYQSEAARAVVKLRGDLASVQVSRPKALSNWPGLGRQTWYSCLKGIKPPRAYEEKLPRFVELLDGSRHLGPDAPYHVIMFFSGPHLPEIHQAFDLPLCRQVDFEPITAKPPII